jgi:adenylate cyclase
MVVISDTNQCDLVIRASSVRLGVRALVIAPITTKGPLVAALAVEQFDHPRRFTSEELRLIRLVAEQTAAALDRATLYREAQENARREALIRRINSAIHRSLDGDVLQTIVNEMGAALGVCRCRLAMLPSPLPEVFPITHEFVADCCKDRRPPFSHIRTHDNVLLQELLGSATPVIVDEPGNDFRLGQSRERYRDAEVKSLLLASIRFSGRPIGVFSLYHCEHQHRWTPSEIDIAQSVAEQAAVALRQSELYREVRESATRAALVNQTRRKPHLLSATAW